ncbi:MAG: hypothetical protein WCC48_10850 [Anaeromyxobacteraceae bacterium]
MQTKTTKTIAIVVATWAGTALAERYLNRVADWLEPLATGSGVLSGLGASAVALLASAVRVSWAVLPATAVYLLIRRSLSGTERAAQEQERRLGQVVQEGDLGLRGQLDRTRADLDKIAGEIRKDLVSRDELARNQIAEAMSKLATRVENAEALASRAVGFEDVLDLFADYKRRGNGGWLLVAVLQEPAVRFLELVGLVQIDSAPGGRINWRPTRVR